MTDPDELKNKIYRHSTGMMASAKGKCRKEEFYDDDAMMQKYSINAIKMMMPMS